MNLFNKIFIGYKELLSSCSTAIKTVVKIFLFLLFILVFSVIIVYPLWYFAEHDPKNYSYFVIGFLILMILLFSIYKIIKISKSIGFLNFLKNNALPLIKKVILYLIFISLILTTIFIFSYSLIIGLFLTILTLFIIGLFKFVIKI